MWDYNYYVILIIVSKSRGKTSFIHVYSRVVYVAKLALLCSLSYQLNRLFNQMEGDCRSLLRSKVDVPTHQVTQAFVGHSWPVFLTVVRLLCHPNSVSTRLVPNSSEITQTHTYTPTCRLHTRTHVHVPSRTVPGPHTSHCLCKLVNYIFSVPGRLFSFVTNAPVQIIWTSALNNHTV